MRGLPTALHHGLRRRAEAAAAWVREQGAAGRTVTVVHHIDADGVSSGAIACEALHRAGVPFVPLAVKSMDDTHVAIVHASAPQALWFCDLGSTVASRFAPLPRLVCDHHQLVRDGLEETFAHVNPLLDGLPGEEISGAGGAYLVAAALSDANADLLPLALVGASADLQDRKAPGGFQGTNRLLLELGSTLGLVASRQDLAWYGLETRPLVRLLAYAREPEVPGATGERRLAEAFLAPLLPGAAVARATWAELDDGLRRGVRSALVERLLDAGLGERVPALFREVVTITAHEGGGPLRELQEFATLLNGTARYGRPEVGLAVARGDRGPAYDEALGLLKDHRKHLVGALDAFQSCGTLELLGVQWVHLEDRVRDTVVGTVCGMALEGLGLRQDLVLVGLAWTPDGRTKASARAPRSLQGRVDLSAAMREAAAFVGGQGGGHRGAAGATVPRGAESAFMRELDGRIALQLGRGGHAPGLAGRVRATAAILETDASGAISAIATHASPTPAPPARARSEYKPLEVQSALSAFAADGQP